MKISRLLLLGISLCLFLSVFVYGSSSPGKRDPFRLYQHIDNVGLISGKPQVVDYNHDGYLDITIPNVFLPLNGVGSFLIFQGTQNGFVPGPPAPAIIDPGKLVLGGQESTFFDCNGDGILDYFCTDNLGGLWVSIVDKNYEFGPFKKLIDQLPRQSIFEITYGNCLFSAKLNGKDPELVFSRTALTSKLRTYFDTFRLENGELKHHLNVNGLGEIVDICVANMDKDPALELTFLTFHRHAIKQNIEPKLVYWDPYQGIKTPMLFGAKKARSVCFCDGRIWVGGGQENAPSIVYGYEVDLLSKQFIQKAAFKCPNAVASLSDCDGQLLVETPEQLILVDTKTLSVIGKTVVPWRVISDTKSRHIAVADVNHDGNKDIIRMSGSGKLNIDIFVNNSPLKYGYKTIEKTGSTNAELTIVGGLILGEDICINATQLKNAAAVAWCNIYNPHEKWGPFDVPPRAVFLLKNGLLKITLPKRYDIKPDWYFQGINPAGQTTKAIKVILPRTP